MRIVVAVLLVVAAAKADAAAERFGWPQVLWESVADSASGTDCAALSLAVDSRDAVVVAGRLSSLPFVARFSSGGRRTWMVTALGKSPGQWGEARLVAIHGNRDITVYGMTASSAEDPYPSAVLARFTPAGVLAWSRTIGLPGIMRFDPAAMSALPGGGLVLTGTGRRPETPGTALWCVARLDPRLRVEWLRVHDNRNTGEVAPGAVVIDSGGNAWVMGTGRVGLGPWQWLVEGWGSRGERRDGTWGEAGTGCTVEAGRLAAIRGSPLYVAGDQSCPDGKSAAFVCKLGRKRQVLWKVSVPASGRVLGLAALFPGGVVGVGEEARAEGDSEAVWPFAMRWNSSGDLVMACRGLRKGEVSARYAAAAADPGGNTIVAGESTVEVKGTPVRRLFVRKMKF